MFSLEFEDEEESHFYLILKAGSFHLMLDMHLCNVQSCKRSYASQPLRYAKNYIFGNKQTDPNMCYMSSNKVNFAFQMTQDYLILLLSMNDANNNINVPIFQKKDSTWQILFSKERNELERLYVKNAFSISCVKMVNSKQEEEQQSLEKKEETPIHFLIVVFGLFFFSGTFSLFFIEKKTTATSLRLWLNSEKCVFVYFFCSSFDRVFSLVPFSLLFLLLVPKTAGSNPKSLSI